MTVPKILRISIPVFLFAVLVLGLVSFSTAAQWAALTITHKSAAQAYAPMEAADTAGAPSGVECTLSNYSIRPVYYGHEFSVEKLDQSRWVPVPAPDNLRFELSIAVVQPLSSVKILYPTSLFTEPSGAGSYRIVQTVWTGTPATAKKHALYCEFIVE